jgi:putative restriction endonuclease
MKADQRLWTRDELILAFNLYCQLPFGKLDQNTKEVIELGLLIDRKPGAVSYKLNNLASLDPSLKARGIKGAVNGSKLDKQIWEEFINNREELIFESEILKAKLKNVSIESTIENEEDSSPELLILKEGKTREALVKLRVNQNFFRKMVLTAYNNSCCITGINRPELLIASHIKRWSSDIENRLNPCNGLALNPLHDRAFEVGLISITPDLIIKVSSILLDYKGSNPLHFSEYHNKSIKKPSKFYPDPQFLEYHFNERFQQ